MTRTLIPNEKNIKVFADDKKLEKLEAFEIVEKRNFRSVKELLAGEVSLDRLSENYKLKLTFGGEEEFPEEFILKVITPSYLKKFIECKVTEVREKASSQDGFLLEYIVSAKRVHISKI